MGRRGRRKRKEKEKIWEEGKGKGKGKAWEKVAVVESLFVVCVKLNGRTLCVHNRRRLLFKAPSNHRTGLIATPYPSECVVGRGELCWFGGEIEREKEGEKGGKKNLASWTQNKHF